MFKIRTVRNFVEIRSVQGCFSDIYNAMSVKRKFCRLEGRAFSAESEWSGLTRDRLDLELGLLSETYRLARTVLPSLHSRPNSYMFVILRRAEDAQNAFKWTING